MANIRAPFLVVLSGICALLCPPRTGRAEEYQPTLTAGAAEAGLGPSDRSLASYLRYYPPRFGEYLLGLQYDRISAKSRSIDQPSFNANCLGAQLFRRSLNVSVKGCHNPDVKIGPGDLNKFQVDALIVGVGSELMLPLWDGDLHFILGVGILYGYFLEEAQCMNAPCSLKKGSFHLSGSAGIGF